MYAHATYTETVSYFICVDTSLNDLDTVGEWIADGLYENFICD